MTGVVATKTQSSARHWAVAAGAFIVMIGASIVLSGLLLVTVPIISDLYYQRDAAGTIVLRTLPNGMRVPVEIHGGQGAFLIYFSILMFAVVVALMFFAGQLVAKYGSRVMLIVSGIVMTGGLALFAESTGNLTFYIAGALLSLGYGLSLGLVPPTLINAWFVARRGLVLGIVMAGTAVGGLIWATIGPSLAQSSTGWRGVIWIMAAAMAVCTFLPALLLIRNKPADVGLIPYGADIAQATASGAPHAPSAVESGLTPPSSDSAFHLHMAGLGVAACRKSARIVRCIGEVHDHCRRRCPASAILPLARAPAA